MLKKVLSLFLAAVLMISLLPAAVSAEEDEKADAKAALIKQISDTYTMARRRSGWWSFNGYCGTYVNYQAWILGIDTRLYCSHGCLQYDRYSVQEKTEGGYRVENYPAGKYTLRSALEAITNNGTEDAYNMIVGFQRTNTAAGSIYGHAVYIHGIIDGMVYFSESFPCSVDGKYYAEGKPIVTSIANFSNMYGRWTTFEGINYFGVKTYANECKVYSGGFSAIVLADSPLYAEPGDEGVHEPQTTDESIVQGQRVKVMAMVQTPKGDWWYRLESKRYVPADVLKCIEAEAPEFTVENAVLPTLLRKGYGKTMSGTVSVSYGTLKAVTLKVYNSEGQLVIEGTATGNSSTISLSDYRLDRQMTFRYLAADTYRLEIWAQTSSYAMEDGSLATMEHESLVQTHSFQVVSNWNAYASLSFHAGVGQAELEDMTVAIGDEITQFPRAEAQGYTFLGWSLTEDGEILDSIVVTKDTKLYAVWKKTTCSAVNGWQYVDGFWVLGTEDHYVEGWVGNDCVRFYQTASGKLLTGWQEIYDRVFYFNEFGAQLTGWQVIEGKTYYLLVSGDYATGWREIEGTRYLFADNGVCISNTSQLPPVTMHGTHILGHIR